MSFDVVVVGAGPVGLCFVRSLAGSGLRIALVERQDEKMLAVPTEDGREIAITHHSRQLLRELGLWQRFREEEIGTLRDAMVLNGNARPGLMFRHAEAGKQQLGWLLPNHAIRRAAYAEVAGMTEVRRITGMGVTAVKNDRDGAEVILDDGEVLHTALVVAADSRFSSLRRFAGIPASMHDFGKVMLVCRMTHEREHEHVAWEWFDFGQTLALLPLHDPCTSSVVLTLSHQQMQALLSLDDGAFEIDMARRFQQRLGRMTVAGPRCTYPLVGVYARRFVAERFAVIGDAAVGMHPVTAHGFNFGLLGLEVLAREMRAANAAQKAIWSPDLLQRYEREHRRATYPLYMATQLLANLYTDDRRPARVLRNLALAAGTRLGPLRHMIMTELTRADDNPAPPISRAIRALRQSLATGS